VTSVWGRENREPFFTVYTVEMERYRERTESAQHSADRGSSPSIDWSTGSISLVVWFVYISPSEDQREVWVMSYLYFKFDGVVGYV
jgi:hypothetical protein